MKVIVLFLTVLVIVLCGEDNDRIQRHRDFVLQEKLAK